MEKPPARHTSRDFVAFLEEVVSLCPRRQEIHIILDNLAAHKTQLVREFLACHPRVQFHFTPTYSSWLNQVELWFAKIERQVIARGIFTSVPLLAFSFGVRRLPLVTVGLLQFIGAWGKVHDSVLALFIDKNGNITKLKISINESDTCITIIQSKRKVYCQSRTPHTAFGAVNGNDFSLGSSQARNSTKITTNNRYGLYLSGFCFFNPRHIACAPNRRN